MRRDKSLAPEARDALERSMSTRLGPCSHDELRVLDAILMGIEAGRDVYGPLDLSKPRAWRLEEAKEHRDALFYRACALISRQDEERRQLRDEVGVELVQRGLEEIAAARPAVTRAPAVDFAFDHTDAGEDKL